jgi:hypothetical protein
MSKAVFCKDYHQDPKTLRARFTEKEIAPTGLLWHTPRYMALHPQFPMSLCAPLTASFAEYKG